MSLQGEHRVQLFAERGTRPEDGEGKHEGLREECEGGL